MCRISTAIVVLLVIVISVGFSRITETSRRFRNSHGIPTQIEKMYKIPFRSPRSRRPPNPKHFFGNSLRHLIGTEPRPRLKFRQEDSESSEFPFEIFDPVTPTDREPPRRRPNYEKMYKIPFRSPRSRRPPNPKHFFGNSLRHLIGTEPRPRLKFRQEDSESSEFPFEIFDPVTPRDREAPRRRPNYANPQNEVFDLPTSHEGLDEGSDEIYPMIIQPPSPKWVSPREKFFQVFFPVLVGLLAWLGTLMMMTSSNPPPSKSENSEIHSNGQNIMIHMDTEDEPGDRVAVALGTKDEDQKHEKLLKSLDVTDQVLSIVERGLLLAVRKVELLNVLSGLTYPGGGSGGGGQGGGRIQEELQNLTKLTTEAQSLLQGTLGLVKGDKDGLPRPILNGTEREEGNDLEISRTTPTIIDMLQVSVNTSTPRPPGGSMPCKVVEKV